MISFDSNKNGKHTIFCKNTGQIILEKYYLNNLLHGKYVYYWSNGRIRFSGTFSKNKRIGTWTNYDKYGQVILEEDYS